ncbi:MAG: hypothetical protein IKQ87_01960, partial [Clostridia bacterium]|nr:hypothetical protein [Clostridia bacterium]
MKITSMKRTLATLLALVMVLGLCPVSVFAYDDADVEREFIEEAETIGDEFEQEPVDAVETEEQVIAAEDYSPVVVSGKLPVGATVTAVNQMPQPSVMLRGAKALRSAPEAEEAETETELARYDITILDENGDAWQPAEPVDVTITDDAFGDGEILTVYYVDEDGNRPERSIVVSENNTVTFMAEHFSVYLVTETTTDTYVFYVGDKVYYRQKIVANDTLFEPQVPDMTSGQRFTGWYIEGSDTPIDFGEDGTYTVTSVSGKEEIRVNARFDDYYYATFRDQDGNVLSRIGAPAGSSISELPNYI